ncbi:MAG: hypothetical protein SFV32_13905 [Opitutaceae bacterium]|nr:hypothetical protein [Opitutaceae bacterium]
MKLAAYLSIIALASANAHATNTFPTNGNVGINTTSPAFPLHIASPHNSGFITVDPTDGAIELGSGNDGFSFIDFRGNTHLNHDFWGRLAYNDDSGFQLVRALSTNPVTLSTYSRDHNNYLVMYAGPNFDAAGELAFERQGSNAGNIYLGGNSFGNIIFRSGGYNVKMVVASNGNIGIGDSTPATKLSIAGTLSAPPAIALNETNVRQWKIGPALTSSGKFSIQNGSTGQDALTIDAFSNVGVGTTSPTHKLSVSGTIRAKELIVDSTGWADFVFAEGYQLPSLGSVEAHVQEHGHLPGFPSQEEISHEGVNVGKLQPQLVEKIEQLFLHQIALEKRVDDLESENKALRALLAAGNKE